MEFLHSTGHIRTVPVPAWVKSAIDCWMAASKIRSGRLFRCVSNTGSIRGRGHLREGCLDCGALIRETCQSRQIGPS